jgi:hypothetical protein
MSGMTVYLYTREKGRTESQREQTMTIERRRKFLIDNRIHDGLPKEFVAKGLWKAATMSIDEGIAQREKEIAALGMLRAEISVEGA